MTGKHIPRQESLVLPVVSNPFSYTWPIFSVWDKIQVSNRSCNVIFCYGVRVRYERTSFVTLKVL